ncbi:unnamed protein product [Caenorhabditis nigoni]
MIRHLRQWNNPKDLPTMDSLMPDPTTDAQGPNQLPMPTYSCCNLLMVVNGWCTPQSPINGTHILDRNLGGMQMS